MWTCSRCQESVENSFEVCWNCGTSKDGVLDPTFKGIKEGLQHQDTTGNQPAVDPLSEPGDLHCPKCSGVMIQGWVADSAGEQGLDLGRWHKGQPIGGWFYGVKNVNQTGLPLGAFRCQRCGYVEFYAASNYEPRPR